MSRRTHGTEDPLERAVQDSLDGVDHGTRREQRRIDGSRTGRRVAVEPVDLSASGHHFRYVLAAVDPLKLGQAGGSRLHELEAPFQSRVAKAAAQGLEPLRTFGMPPASVMLAEEGVVVEPDSHRSS
jgi:hypothetical protein